MSIVKINGYDFLQIDVIGRGRCFSGSVLLGIMVNNYNDVSPVPLDSAGIQQLVQETLRQLSVWMKDNIIDVVNNRDTQLTCDFVKAVFSSQKNLMLLPENMTGDDVWETDFQTLLKTFTFFDKEDSCFNNNEARIKKEVKEIQRNPHYQQYKANFLALCQELTKSVGGDYAYAEPEAGLAQIIVNKIKKNIAIVDNNNTIVLVFYVDYNQQNNEDTIFVKKLDYAHYHALVPTTTQFIKASSLIPSLEVVQKNEIKNDNPNDLREIFPMFSNDMIQFALEMNEGNIEETTKFLIDKVPQSLQPIAAVSSPSSIPKSRIQNLESSKSGVVKNRKCCEVTGDPECCTIMGGKSVVRRRRSNKNKKLASLKKNTKMTRKRKTKKHKSNSKKRKY